MSSLPLLRAGMLRECWHFRDFIFASVKREFVSRYLGTQLGLFWTVAQPWGHRRDATLTQRDGALGPSGRGLRSLPLRLRQVHTRAGLQPLSRTGVQRVGLYAGFCSDRGPR